MKSVPGWVRAVDFITTHFAAPATCVTLRERAVEPVLSTALRFPKYRLPTDPRLELGMTGKCKPLITHWKTRRLFSLIHWIHSFTHLFLKTRKIFLEDLLHVCLASWIQGLYPQGSHSLLKEARYSKETKNRTLPWQMLSGNLQKMLWTPRHKIHFGWEAREGEREESGKIQERWHWAWGFRESTRYSQKT